MVYEASSLFFSQSLQALVIEGKGIPPILKMPQCKDLTGLSVGAVGCKFDCK